MQTFSIVASVVSIILGLSITRLLSGLVTLFRIRREMKVEWVTLAWAAVIFFTQLDYWWGINDIPKLTSAFSFGDFLLLILPPFMLFIASATLLPSRKEDEAEGLRAYFEKDGRFGLLALSGCLTASAILNLTFFQQPLWAEWLFLDVPMIVLPIVGFFAKARKIYAGIALLYLPLSAFDLWFSINS